MLGSLLKVTYFVTGNALTNGYMTSMDMILTSMQNWSSSKLILEFFKRHFQLFYCSLGVVN